MKFWCTSAEEGLFYGQNSLHFRGSFYGTKVIWNRNSCLMPVLGEIFILTTIYGVFDVNNFIIS
jgi:hypothetical protein